MNALDPQGLDSFLACVQVQDLLFIHVQVQTYIFTERHDMKKAEQFLIDADQGEPPLHVLTPVAMMLLEMACAAVFTHGRSAACAMDKCV